MSVETYLGNPPPNVVAWIMAHAQPVTPTAPDGIVLYKTSTSGAWLQSNASITEDGEFVGFNEKISAVEVIIPSKDINGNDVVSIGIDAFNQCSSLTNVTIPDSITAIDADSFNSCSSLTSISLDNIEFIGETAFFNCSSLTTVTIPVITTSIGMQAFLNCSGLTNVIFKDRTISQVQALSEYPWGIEDESIITVA